MLVVLWTYTVRPGSENAFEALYAADGDWAVLFRQHGGYIDTALLRGADGGYLTIDRWDSAAAYDAFLDTARADYAVLDARGDALTLEEHCLGRFMEP